MKLKTHLPAAIVAAFIATLAAAQSTSTGATAPVMLSIAQAVTIAETSQRGTAYDVRRESAGPLVVYRVKVSTVDKGAVDVRLHAFDGRVLATRKYAERDPEQDKG